jgi:hypothetical protein
VVLFKICVSAHSGIPIEFNKKTQTIEVVWVIDDVKYW